MTSVPKTEPTGVLPLQPDNQHFKLRRQAIGLAVGPPTAVGQGQLAAGLVQVEDLGA